MATTGFLSPIALILQAFSDQGVVGAGYQINTYLAGSTTPVVTYTDATLTVANTNPIVLNANGRLPYSVWGPSGVTMKMVLRDANGNAIANGTVDNLPMINDVLTSINSKTPAETSAGVTPTNTAYPELDPRRYGADTTGATDTTAALAATISVAQQYTAAQIRFPQAGQYRIDGGLTWDLSKVSIDLQGSTLDFSHFVTGNAIQFTQSQASLNIRGLVNAAHPLQNGRLIGPGVSNTNVTALYINDSTNNSIPNVKLRGVSFQDFAQDIVFNNGAFCCSFIGCNFTVTTGTATTWSVTQNAAANSAERNTFIDCQWFNKPYDINQLSSSGGDMYLVGCSLDYFTRAVSNSGGGGQVFITDSHIESNTDTDNWMVATGTHSVISLSQCTIAMTGNKTAFDMFFSDPTCTNGGVFVRDCLYGPGANTMTTKLIGGGGNSRCANLMQYNAGAHPTISLAQNLLAYGGFESANYTAEWTLGGTTPAVRSTAQAHTGTYSLSFPGGAGNVPNANTTLPCKPAEYFQGEYWYLAPTLGGTGASFNAQIDFLDKGNNSLGTTVITSVTANITSWTRANFKSQAPAPPGTVSARLSFFIGTGAAGASSYVDDVIANVQ